MSAHRTQHLDQRSKITPPLPPAGGRRAGVKKLNQVEEALRAVGADPPENGARRFAIDAVLAPLVRQRRLDAPSLEGSLRALADWIARKDLSQREAGQIVAKVLEARKATVKPSDIEDAVKAELGLRPAPALLAGDPVLMARWTDVLAELTDSIGPDKTRSWFSTLVIDGISGGTARLATHQAFVAAQIERDFSAQLRAALNVVFGVVPGGIASILITTRRAAA